MILVYNSTGFVQQTVDEPVAEGYAELLSQHGLHCLRVLDKELTGRDIHSIYVDCDAAEWAPFRPSDEGESPSEIRPAQWRERTAPAISVSKSKITADDTDAAVLEGVPENATIWIDDESYTIEGGTLTITSPMPATYHLKCQSWPFLDWETTIEAVA